MSFDEKQPNDRVLFYRIILSPPRVQRNDPRNSYGSIQSTYFIDILPTLEVVHHKDVST